MSLLWAETHSFRIWEFGFLLKMNTLVIQRSNYLLPAYSLFSMLLVSGVQQRTREIIPTVTKLLILGISISYVTSVKCTASKTWCRAWLFSLLLHISNLLCWYFPVTCLLIIYNSPFLLTWVLSASNLNYWNTFFKVSFFFQQIFIV